MGVLAQIVNRRVVVVGAGLAGYSTAAKLIEEGITDIVVLEAEDRIGGRVHTVPYRDGRIDMGRNGVRLRVDRVVNYFDSTGAQWLHGQEENFIYEMIDGNFNFGSSRFGDVDHKYYFTNGQPVERKHGSELERVSLDILERSFDEMAHFDGGSVGHFFEKTFLRRMREPKFINVTFTLANKMHDFQHTRINNYYASNSWYDVSARLLGTKPHTGGDQWVTWNDEGFSTVFDFISVSSFAASS